MADSKKYGRTANLFDKSNGSYNAYVDDAGTWRYVDTAKSVKIPCLANTTYTLSIPENLSVFRIYEISDALAEPPTQAAEIIRGGGIDRYTFTTASTTAAIIFQGSAGAFESWFNGLMLNTGSTALPYEPYGYGWQHSLRKLGTETDTITTLPSDIYADGTNATVGLKGQMVQTGTPTPQNPIQPQECGDLETTGVHAGQYKIPISSANTTTPVYLGEVETTRKIKELVLKGGSDENWVNSSSGYNAYFMYMDSNHNYPEPKIINSPIFCNIAVMGTVTEYRNEPWILQSDNSLAISTDPVIVGGTGINAWKAYLQAQYAAGTPIIVWYVLAEPTTGIVNEPIRKIGDYADEVSGITIPTITGKDSFDVLTTLKPSEVELTYTGWHDASVQEAVRTVNIYDKYNILDIPNLGLRYGIECELGTYSIYNNTNNTVYWGTNDWASRHVACEPNSTTTITLQGTGVSGFIMPYNEDSLGEITIVKGSTVPDHYIPYIDWD